MTKKNKRKEILAKKADIKKKSGNTGSRSSKKKKAEQQGKREIINNKSLTIEKKERAKRIDKFNEDKSKISNISIQLANLGVNVKNINQKERFNPETKKLVNLYFSLRKAQSRRSKGKKKNNNRKK